MQPVAGGLAVGQTGRISRQVANGVREKRKRRKEGRGQTKVLVQQTWVPLPGFSLSLKLDVAPLGGLSLHCRLE
jgi:hypothetical protein